MSAYATNKFIGDGATTQYEFSFSSGYIDRSHVKAYRENIITGVRTDITLTPAMFVGPYTLDLGSTTAPDEILVIYRYTPRGAALVDFTDGAYISEAALDLVARQGVFIGAELTDRGVGSTGGGGGTSGVSSVNGRVGDVTLTASDVGLGTVMSTIATKQTLLVSGTNIKTINGQSILGSGDLAVAGGSGVVTSVNGAVGDVVVTPASIGLGSVNNTADVDKPVSIATAAALSGKQAALVSGTNLKTVNGQSLLGAGDVAVSGGGAPAAVVENHSSFTWTDASVEGPPSLFGRKSFSTTPGTWASAVGRMTTEFQFQSNGYFAANPNGHFAVVTRCTNALVDSSLIRGQGFICGDFTASDAGGAIDYKPTSALQSWFYGVGLWYGLWRTSGVGRAHRVADNVLYRVIIDSTKANDGNRYLRYRLYRKDVVNGNWNIEVDTGDVLDHNTVADLTQSGLTFGHVARSNLSAWSLAFTDIKTTWGPCESATTDQLPVLSRWGADLEGDLRFLGERRIVQLNNDGADMSKWTTFRSTANNFPSAVVVAPNGAATSAYTACVNTANPSGNYKSMTTGIKGNEAFIEGTGWGTDPAPDITINRGYANTVARYSLGSYDLYSNLRFIGEGRTIQLNNDGADMSKWTTFRATANNQASALVAAPTGTGTSSFVACVNSSTLAGAFGSATVGIKSGYCFMESTGWGGGTVPEFRINVGFDNTVATFRSTGLHMAGATKGVGQPITTLVAPYNYGGYNAVSFAATGSMDIDQFCSPSGLSSALSGLPGSGGYVMMNHLDVSTRPLYAILSLLIADLKAKKVI